MSLEMTGFKEMIAKDARVILRNRLLLVILMLYPFVFMAIVGLTFSENREMRLGVVYQDGGGQEERIWVEGQPYDQRGLVEHFLGDIADIEEYPDAEAAQNALRQGLADAVLVLPPDFVGLMKTLDETADVQVIIDQSNLFQASSTEMAVRGALSNINRILVEEKLSAVNAGLEVLITGGDFFGSPVIGMTQVVKNLEEVQASLTDEALKAKLEEELDLARTLIDDLGDSAAYLQGTAIPLEIDISGVSGRAIQLNETAVPLLLGLSTLWTGILCAAILMAMEEEEGMRQRLRLTRMSDFTFISAKSATAFTIVFAQSLIMCLIALLLYPSLGSNIFLSLLVVSLTAFSSIGIGIFIAALVRDVAGSIIISVLVSFPVIFLSGAIFPLNQMPDYMRVAARIIPFTWAFDTLNGVMLRGDPFTTVLRNLLVIAGFGVVLLCLGAWLARRTD